MERGSWAISQDCTSSRSNSRARKKRKIMKSDRRHDPHTTLGTADTVGELGLAELRRGSAMETAGLL